MSATQQNPPTKRVITAADVQHGDFPWCHVEWMSNSELVGAEKLLLVRATFPPGEAHNFHKHPAREEILYFLEGRAEQWIGREKHLLGPGDMAHIPAGTPHATYNPGPDALKFLAILSPVDAPGEFTVDVFNEEPWVSLRPPRHYPKG
jgi:quercetin dioxygenase-like cupin family protein